MGRITIAAIRNFLGLDDTPSTFSGQSNKYLKVNTAETSLELSTVPKEFTDLDDTPSSFSGQSGKYPKVNAGENALEFAEVAAGGLSEGDYTSWSHVWTHTLPDGLSDYSYCSFFIDEKNDVVNVAWSDSASARRLGIFSLSDFSTVYLSSAGSPYSYQYPHTYAEDTFNFGEAALYHGGIACSLQSYIAILCGDYHTLEVWRGGSSVLWSHDIRDETAGDNVYSCIISPTGKYILILNYSGAQLILYVGS